MIINYLINSVRILEKERLYTLINSIGLAIGLATCFLIYTWVRFETSYDTFQDSNRVFRVVTNWDESTEAGIASTYPMIKTRVLPQFPEVQESARLFDRGFLGSKTRIAYQEKVFTDNAFFYGDPSILNIFPFMMVDGDRNTALDKPNAVILTRETAEKFFGETNPIGKIIVVGAGQEFEVTGVIENIPSNTHFHFDLLASMQAHPWIKEAEQLVWSGVVFHTYVKLREGSSPDNLEVKLSNLLDNFPDDPEGNGKNLNLQLQQVQDIHLKSNKKFELETNGSIKNVYLFVTIAVLILIVAIINYTNLATARHTQRFKEVGVRKVLGASRAQLITQFLTESLLISGISLLIAIILAELLRPLLITFSDKNYFAQSFITLNVLYVGVPTTLLIGLLTGIAPALTLSAFNPVKLFKVIVSNSPRRNSLRKVLVISQFTISIVLTICTAITYKQVRYLQNVNLGYNLDHVLVLNIGFNELRDKYELLKTQLASNTSIIGSTATSQLPTDIQTSENIDFFNTRSVGVNYISIDKDFFNVMQIPINLGSELINSIQISDTINHFVLNERALEVMGLSKDESLHQFISIRHGNQKPGKVMGIIDNFHFQSLHHPIQPLVLEFNPMSYQYMLIKIKPESLTETIEFIEKKWKDISNGIPFDFMFLDQEYDNLYRSEQQSSTLFTAFSILAILVSSLGLFGLSSFAIQRRTKEIGLRKIMGADSKSIFLLVSHDFGMLLLISFILAIPVGYYFMISWLSNFSFKAPMDPWIFILSGMFNILLGIAIISYHSFKLSKTNPAETLKYE